MAYFDTSQASGKFANIGNQQFRRFRSGLRPIRMTHRQDVNMDCADHQFADIVTDHSLWNFGDSRHRLLYSGLRFVQILLAQRQRRIKL